MDDLAAFARRFDLEMPPGLEADMAQQIDTIRCFADTLPALRQLRAQGVPLVLVSNLASPYKWPVFELGLVEYFDAIAFSCDRGLKKPNPAFYQLALKRLKVAPEQVLMVGDSERCDFDGPRQLGMAARQLVRDGAGHSSGCIRSFADLPVLCARYDRA